MFYNRNMLAPLVAALLVLSALPAGAQNVDEVNIDREEWHVVGWNDACGVAYTVLSYPKLGEAMAAEPFSTRVGTMLIPVEKEKAEAAWTLEADGALSYSQKALDKAEGDLKKGGYTRKGFPEIIQDVPVGDQPTLAERILSTTTLAPRLKTGWPDADWRWAGGDYNPLATCALLVFQSRSQPWHHSFLLVRVYNPRARLDRSYAHASNAQLLFDSGNLDAAAVEADTAARLAPELPIARYEHAAMLALTGYTDQAVAELAAAVKLEPAYREKARDDRDFADLRSRPDFKATTE